MEDQERGLDQNQVKPLPVKGRSPSRKELTVMVIGNVGKVRSFKISRKIITYALIFFFIYIILSLYILSAYFGLRTTHKTRSEKVQKLEEELNDKTKSLVQKELYIEGLEDYLNTVRGELNETGSSPKTVTKKSNPPPEIPAGIKKQNTASDESRATIVEVKDIVFRETDSGLTLDFKLLNKKPEKKAAEGYIHIIVMDKDKNYPVEWNYVHDKLSKGFPVNYKRGEIFLIQRFKPYQRPYKKIGPDSERPSFIRVLVYDRSGQIILEKEFPVINESPDNPS